MKRLKKLKPAFWDHRDITTDQSGYDYSFSRKWKLIVLFTSFMALLPLTVMTVVEFSLTRRIIENAVNNNMIKILNSVTAAKSLPIDQRQFIQDYIPSLNLGKDNDIFVVKDDGALLTASYYFGKKGTLDALDIKLFSQNKGVIKTFTPNELPVVAGYVKIPDSSSILVLTKSEKWLAGLYFTLRLKLVGFLAASIILILLSIMGMSTYLVGRIHAADQKRAQALRHAGYTNKLASIGRLSSGVAHEINNPLAIINQKTGLIMDLLSLREDLAGDERLIHLTNDVLDAVKRCGTITRQLLDFARDMEAKSQPVDIGEVIEQTLAFIEKEAERKNIIISVDNLNPVSGFECDRGSLHQIFLNLFENALAAMEGGGNLKIEVLYNKMQDVTITIGDNGSGISDDDIDKIFEPFYSSKNEHWGTGLGLSITYGLIKQIGGEIKVKSKLDQGTVFTLLLPFKPESNDKTPESDSIVAFNP